MRRRRRRKMRRREGREPECSKLPTQVAALGSSDSELVLARQQLLLPVTSPPLASLSRQSRAGVPPPSSRPPSAERDSSTASCSPSERKEWGEEG
eukprot:755139-Hanusia_phi.AAC.1